MPSRQDALRRMRFDQMLKKKDPEMYERYQEERLQNRKRKERADYPPDARPKKNENMDQDVTHPYPEEMYLQEDQEIKGFAMGSRKAIKGYKYGGLK